MAAISQTTFSNALNENVSISLKISPKFVPKVQINNILSLVQIMAWCRPSDKPLSEPMMVSLLCIYESLGLNELKKIDCYNWTPSNVHPNNSVDC